MDVNFFANFGNLAISLRIPIFSSSMITVSPSVRNSIALSRTSTVSAVSWLAFSITRKPPRSLFTTFAISISFSWSANTYATLDAGRFSSLQIAGIRLAISLVLPVSLPPITMTFPVLEVLSAAAICTSQSALISCSFIPGTFTKYVNSFFSSSVRVFSLGIISDGLFFFFGWMESMNCSSSSSSLRGAFSASSSSSSDSYSESSSYSSSSESSSTSFASSTAAILGTSSSSCPMLSLSILAMNSSSDIASSAFLRPAGPFMNSSSAA